MVKKILKFFYRLIPFKKLLFLGLKKLWKPPRSLYQHLYFNGVIHIPVDQAGSFKMYHYGYQVENDLFWSGINGNWEKSSLDIWKRLSASANVIFDIGANTGVYSLLSKSLNKNARVYAFEPVRRVYEKLVRNVGLNGYSIQCFDKAVSDKIGTALIHDSNAEHEYTASLQDSPGKGYTRTFQVETTTIDQLINELELDQLDLIKIDVESHEPAVLKGFQENITRFRPTILIEILNDEIGKKVEALLNNNGEYHYFNILESSGPKRVDHISGTADLNYLICTTGKAKALGIL